MRLLGISGKKQSGKNTCFNYLLGLKMLELSIVRDKVVIMPNGKLHVSDIFGDEQHAGTFDVERHNDVMLAFLGQFIYPTIKNYSFAYDLKLFCVEKFGIPHENMFGSDEQKNAPINLKWEDMPGVISEDAIEAGKEKYNIKDETEFLEWAGLIKQSGYMSGRDLLKYFGTSICRRIYNGCWVESTLNRIKKESPEFAVITDARFPDEVAAVNRAEGKVIRLTRDILEDNHESENLLNKDRYDWSNFAEVIDNQNMSITEQNQKLYSILESWDWT